MDPYLGEIRPFAFNFAPRGWALCQGQILPIQQNIALFSILGTTYGGNGTSTFGLPNFSGRAALHQGSGSNGTYDWGETSGTETAQLLLSNLPTHTHAVTASTNAATTQSPAGAVFAAPDARLGPPMYLGTPAAATMSTSMLVAQGSGQPFTILQPSLTVNFCIALQGIFPTRN